MKNLPTSLKPPQGSQDPDIITRALVTIREHLGMEVAYLSEFIDADTMIFRAMDAPGLEGIASVGGEWPTSNAYCKLVAAGRLPELIPDTSAIDLCATLPVTDALPIRSHVSVPIHRTDGTIYGMFCCLSHTPKPSLNDRDLSIMKSFAALSGDQVRSVLDEQAKQARLTSLIETAVRDRSFDIHYQPICELETGELSGFEALCRFEDMPYRSPDKWFADAEVVGLGIDLELAAIEAALGGLAVLPENKYISINASPCTVSSGRLEQVLANRPLERIILEITEHSDVKDEAALMEQIRLWRYRGFSSPSTTRGRVIRDCSSWCGCRQRS